MRLIDLDEIEYFMLVDKDGIPRYKIEIGEGLPTVKAIPIEWIEKYIWSANTHEEKRALRKMYMDWEKENGK